MYNNSYLNDDWYRNMNNSMYQSNNMSSLFPPEEGYNKGNLFASLYDQYKNYRPAILKASNERERLLLDLSRMAFAAHELNLYLDLNPTDISMLTLFNDYRMRTNELIKEYESKYGPLTVSSDNVGQNNFMWVKDTWPWEERYRV